MAKAAVDTGVAREPYESEEAYRTSLQQRIDLSERVMVPVKVEVSREATREHRLPRIVLPEGEDPRVIEAAQEAREKKLAFPLLLGDPLRILACCRKLGVPFPGEEHVVSLSEHPAGKGYADRLVALRARKGMTLRRARRLVKDPRYFAAMMLYEGDADGIVTGIDRTYPEALRPVVQLIRPREGHILSGVYLLLFREKSFLLSDATVNIDPNAEELSEIAMAAADTARFFHMEPRVAMLSFSNFGSNTHPSALKVKRATELVKAKRPRSDDRR